jgi:hypothetical protein
MDAYGAAAYLGLSLNGLNKIVRNDPSFPVHRMGTGPRAHRRFYRSELDRWLRNRCSDHHPAGGSPTAFDCSHEHDDSEVVCAVCGALITDRDGS